ncbi:MAG: STAS/SEC14 domain-containing protein [Bacteroidetes bacterium]|nr:STAS/SEC14 domain-containing protein [Bacteroidota bacterium]
MAKEILLQSMLLTYGEDGILRMKIHENSVIDLRQSKLMNESMMRLAEKKKFPVLIDARTNYTWEKDAQEYIATNSSFRIATAVLITNPVVRMLSNAYVSMFKPSYPVKQFSDEAEAIQWLKEMMSKK